MRPHRNHRTTPSIKRLQEKAHQVVGILEAEYRSPRHSNPHDPLDDLVFIFLSTMTTAPSYQRVYCQLRESIGSWEVVADMDVSTLASLIQGAGLSRQKAPRIIETLRRIREDFGAATLDPLREWSDADVEHYLVGLPGVGIKTAKCVMMYALDRNVLPIDTHVLRVARRLGFLEEEVPYSKAHYKLESIVLPQDRYRFHVNVISHGRAICKAKHPHCHHCCLLDICPFPLKKNKKSG